MARGPAFISTVVLYSLAYDATDVMDHDNLVTALEAQIHISIMLIRTVRKLSIDPIVLAKRWGIIPEKAQKTIQATNQREIRTVLHPSLLRESITNNRSLWYLCKPHSIFLDMMFASRVSRKGNRCTQVYATDFGWAKTFPMASRSEAHETFPLLFVKDGVPSTCICNNARELV